jgi:hypothetical protein
MDYGGHDSVFEKNLILSYRKYQPALWNEGVVSVTTLFLMVFDCCPNQHILGTVLAWVPF